MRASLVSWAMRSTASLLACFGLAAAPAGATVHYTARLDESGLALAVEACVDTAAAERRFDAPHPAAPRFLADPRRSGGGALERDEGTLVARDWRAGECLGYRVDLAAIARENRRGLGYAFDGDLVAAPRAWLWRPRGLERDPDATIAFELPEGWSVSVPWRSLDERIPRRRFALGTRPASWPALVAFGRFPERDLSHGAGAIRYVALGAARRAPLDRYVEETAADVARVLPHAYALRPQLALVPVGAQSDPVPFGQSYRGGGDAVLLYVDPTRALADYHGNWTLAHELVHFAHPYLGDEGRWISEGLATYFQNVVRARAGRITARRAWEELDAGFGRGLENRSTRTLRETSRVMGEERLYMRGYWSGTALALAADLAWRTRREDPTSLEAVMDRYARCCRAARRRWSAEAYLDALDAQAGGAPVLGPLFRTHADRAAFPSIEESYATLGIARDRGTLRYDPAQRTLRRAIMGPGSP